MDVFSDTEGQNHFSVISPSTLCSFSCHCINIVWGRFILKFIWTSIIFQLIHHEHIFMGPNVLKAVWWEHTQRFYHFIVVYACVCLPVWGGAWGPGLLPGWAPSPQSSPPPPSPGACQAPTVLLYCCAAGALEDTNPHAQFDIYIKMHNHAQTQ